MITDDWKTRILFHETAVLKSVVILHRKIGRQRKVDSTPVQGWSLGCALIQQGLGWGLSPPT